MSIEVPPPEPPRGLAGVAAAAKLTPGRGLPPVHLWNPPHCGDIDIRIARDGVWFHDGTPIGRAPLVRLFSTVLRKDPDGFHLVTPVEKLRIRVEDAPFLAVRVDRDGEDLRFLTNVGDEVVAGPDNRLDVQQDPRTGEPAPYLHVRRGLMARLTRPVFYELVEMAELRATPEGELFGVTSGGAWFAVGPGGRRVSGIGPSGGEVTASSPPELLEPWIAARLHPLCATPTYEAGVDNDFRLADIDAFTPAAVLMALVEREEGLNVILTRRADTLKRHSGQIALPGGRTEAGETAVQAALREADEEIGLDPAYVRPVGLGDVLRTHTGFEVTPVVAFLAPGFTITPAAAEVAEVFETPFSFLMDPANHEERVWEAPEGSRTYYAMTHGERMIWGVTAAILRTLWMRLFQAEALTRQSLPRAAAGR